VLTRSLLPSSLPPPSATSCPQLLDDKDDAKSVGGKLYGGLVRRWKQLELILLGAVGQRGTASDGVSVGMCVPKADFKLELGNNTVVVDTVPLTDPLAERVAECIAKNCTNPAWLVGNGKCDDGHEAGAPDCNNAECQWDGGDCAMWANSGAPVANWHRTKVVDIPEPPGSLQLTLSVSKNVMRAWDGVLEDGTSASDADRTEGFKFSTPDIDIANTVDSRTVAQWNCKGQLSVSLLNRAFSFSFSFPRLYSMLTSAREWVGSLQARRSLERSNAVNSEVQSRVRFSPFSAEYWLYMATRGLKVRWSCRDGYLSGRLSQRDRGACERVVYSHTHRPPPFVRRPFLPSLPHRRNFPSSKATRCTGTRGTKTRSRLE
jgi:hypothetical protein